MSRMVIRPPAARVHLEPQQGPLVGRQTYGAVDQAKSYGSPFMGRQSGKPSFTEGGREFQTTWQDFLQINPAREQPRLDFTSGRQPFYRSGHLRRFVRTFMAASPKFRGRWAYVGYIQRQYAERTRMTGVPTRQGTTYRYPRFQIPTREIPLGGGG